MVVLQFIIHIVIICLTSLVKQKHLLCFLLAFFGKTIFLILFFTRSSILASLLLWGWFKMFISWTFFFALLLFSSYASDYLSLSFFSHPKWAESKHATVNFLPYITSEKIRRKWRKWNKEDKKRRPHTQKLWSFSVWTKDDEWKKSSQFISSLLSIIRETPSRFFTPNEGGRWRHDDHSQGRKRRLQVKKKEEQFFFHHQLPELK